MRKSSLNLIRWSGLAAMVGGALWAVTPLREPVFGGGGLPGDPAFRPYNFVLVAIAVLLTAGLLTAGLLGLHASHKRRYGRLGMAGVGVTFIGYALLFFGSIPAVVFGEDGPTGFVRAGQDLGFLGALLSGVGAILLGVALWRKSVAPRLGSLLLIMALPVGIIGVILVSAVGLVDIAGLPLTVLYGGAWVLLGGALWSGKGEPVGDERRVS